MEKRSLPLFIVLSIVTGGIFSLIWLAMIVDDIRELANEKDGMSGGMVLLLSIVTCGIYALVWYYQAGKSIAKIKAMRNMPSDSNMEIVYLLLGIFGLGIVSLALMQNEVNDIIEVSMSSGGYGNQYDGQYNYNQSYGAYNNTANQYNNTNNGYNNGYNNNGFTNSDFEKQQIDNNRQNNYYYRNNNCSGNAQNCYFQNNSSTDVQNNHNQNNFNNSRDNQQS